MIDQRTELMIEEYLPHPPDPDRPEDAYYYLQNTSAGPRVLTVYIRDIMAVSGGRNEYGIYQKRGGRFVRVDAGYGDPLRGVMMHDLYDNRQDCRDQTHRFCDTWESLRRIQMREGLL